MHKFFRCLLSLILLSFIFSSALLSEPPAEDLDLMAEYQKLSPEQKAEVDRRIEVRRQEIQEAQRTLAKDRVELQKQRVFLRRDLALAEKELGSAQDEPSKARLTEKRDTLQSQMAGIDEQRSLKQLNQMEMMQEFDEIVRQAITEFEQEEKKS